MGMSSTMCCKCFWTWEFYGRIVGACPKCGYPELKTKEEFLKSMGLPQALN